MEIKKLKKNYLPMTETAYYILLSLYEPRHGYRIMQHVKEITDGRISIGAGTVYTTLSKFEKAKLINPLAEKDRRKIYELSDKGRQVLKLEMIRLSELLKNGEKEAKGLL